MKRFMIAVLVVLVPLACSPPSPTASAVPHSRPEGQASFVNKVWMVASSSAIDPGQLYVFLSEGTLVIASPNAKPALGTWSRASEGLTMVEDGIPYACDIVALSATEFHIRSHNPGEPVEIHLVAADGPSGGTHEER